MVRRSVIFICTANACRSQIAEGLMCAMAKDRLEVHSAGSAPAGYVHPLAIAVMSEIGIDLSGHWSKGLDEFVGRGFDYVVTVCDGARAACPTLAGRIATYHWPLADPVAIRDDEAAQLAAGRLLRDELKAKLTDLLREDEDHGGPPR